jgi:hypothetical protein
MAAGGMDGTSGLPKSGSRSAGYLSPAADVHHGADAADPAKAPRSRRRVGWRNGADVDRELWPVEAFGGVTDEQFWDDLAADKPLASTARTARPDSGSRGRRPNGGPRPDGRPAGPGAYSPPLSGPADRTAVQPIQAAPVLASTPAQPAPIATPLTPIPAQPAPIATQPPPIAIQPAPIATQLTPIPAHPAPIATQLTPIATQPMPAARQPTAFPGRPRSGGFAGSSASLDDDPLTSPAYSLRRKGAVGGRSCQSSRRWGELSWEQYEAAISQKTQAPSLAGAHAATSGYTDGMPSFGQLGLPASRGKGGAHEARSGYWPDPLRPDVSRPGSSGLPGAIAITVYRPGTGPGDADRGAAAYPPEQPYGCPIQTMDTPPFGEMYGHGSPAGRGGGPRRPNGTRGYGQPGSGIADSGSWGSRHMYPPANGYRNPHEPWGNGRRLGSLRLPRAHWDHA